MKGETVKQLTLPKKIKIGDNWYSVDVAESMRERLYMGEVHYGKRSITLARKSYHGVPLKLSALHETFDNFVEEFGTRLAKAIQSARF
jgi:hypothetical protein